ncbi:hypothetical protein [Reyranella sp.]|uniref:hypothetical protein n=1 Tax=Reyranella sp. TaxID=1929291 RepID=UPI003BA9D0E0
MYQLVGCLLALLAIVAALADAPLGGTLFALLTFLWVVVSKPRTQRPPVPHIVLPWDAVYQTPFGR